MTQVTCPRELDDLSALLFLNELETLLGHDVVVIDFNSLRFVYPFGTLVVAIGIRSFANRRKKLLLSTAITGANRDGGAVSYLRYVGFFTFIGIDVGNNPNEARGSASYLPITTINKTELQDSGLRIQEVIENKSRQLSSIIFRGIRDASRSDVLTFCLRETIRNVFEHAETDQCIAMAQRWGGKTEIAIVDEGRGLLASLSESHHIPDDRTAISEAIKPGISRITEPENSDRWQNSGFGLYVVSELGKRYGSFTIASDNNALFIGNGPDYWASVPVSGTAVKLNLTIQDPDYFGNILQAIVNEGEELAGSIPGARKKASQMSSTSI